MPHSFGVLLGDCFDERVDRCFSNPGRELFRTNPTFPQRQIIRKQRHSRVRQTLQPPSAPARGEHSVLHQKHRHLVSTLLHRDRGLFHKLRVA